MRRYSKIVSLHMAKTLASRKPRTRDLLSHIGAHILGKSHSLPEPHLQSGHRRASLRGCSSVL